MVQINGNELVSSFQNYMWVRYLWGGAAPDTGWDCSGAVNWIVGSLNHLAIPGYGPGGWGPALGHGPVVADWISWVGVTSGGFPQVQPAPGDIIAWGPNAHMGIAVNSSRFISAENPQAGTKEADISGFFSYNPYVLRLLEVRIGTTLVGLPAPPHPSSDDYSHKVRNFAGQLNGTSGAALRAYRAIYDMRRIARY